MMKAPIGLRNLAGDLWSLCCGARRLEFDFGAQTLEIAMDDGHGQLLAEQHLTALRVERGNRRAQFQLDAVYWPPRRRPALRQLAAAPDAPVPLPMQSGRFACSSQLSFIRDLCSFHR